MNFNFSYKDFFKECINKSNKKGFAGDNLEEFLHWKKKFNIILNNALGLNNLPNFNYKVEIAETVEEDDHIRTKFYIETLPNIFMPVYKLTPNKGNGKIAISLPCHGANKDTNCGVCSTPENAERIAQYPDRDYALQFAKKGYTVYCPDQVGGGERAIKPEGSLNGSCTDIGNSAISVGLTYSGLYINDLIKLIDYIYDTNNSVELACVGFSGGGLHAMYLAALDDRIHKCVISGYVHNYSNSVLDTHLCSCNFIPNIWTICEMSDIVSMIAPRPLYIENGEKDKLNGFLGIQDPVEEVAKVKEIYALFNAEEKIKFYTFDDGHVFSGNCYDFLNNSEI